METELIIANFALVAVTIGLVIVTWLYVSHTKKLADETKRMADIMVREFDLRTSSLIELVIGPVIHSGEGFTIVVKIFNRGFYPVSLQEIVFEYWYIKDKQIIGSKRKQINKVLSKNEPIKISLPPISDNELQRDEFPESKELRGGHLGRIVAGKVYAVHKDNFRELPQKSKEVVLDRIM